MNIAVCRIYVGLLQECIRYVKDEKFASSSRGIRRDEGVLRPTQDRVDSNFLGGYVWDGYVLGDVAEIGDVGLDRQTLTEIFGSGLYHSIVATGARNGRQPQQHRGAYAHKSFESGIHPSN